MSKLVTNVYVCVYYCVLHSKHTLQDSYDMSKTEKEIKRNKRNGYMYSQKTCPMLWCQGIRKFLTKIFCDLTAMLYFIVNIHCYMQGCEMLSYSIEM